MAETGITIAPNSFINAAEAMLPSLLSNLDTSSSWIRLIKHDEDLKRVNGPYYGPATQFIVDCFFHIVYNNPAVKQDTKTPLERLFASTHVIHKYIGDFLFDRGLNVIAEAYTKTDVARTEAHLKRFKFLALNKDHVLLGASTPFDDVARTCGSAALLLHTLGVVDDSEIPDVVAASSRLKIIGGIDARYAPKLFQIIGEHRVYLDLLTYDPEKGVGFTDEGVGIIRPYLHKNVGCPTAKIKQGEGTLFDIYWDKINHYTLDDMDFNLTQEQFDQQS